MLLLIKIVFWQLSVLSLFSCYAHVSSLVSCQTFGSYTLNVKGLNLEYSYIFEHDVVDYG